MVYECENCGAALFAGVLACPKCGENFDEAVPSDADAPKRGWRTKTETSGTASATAEQVPPTPPAASHTAITEGFGEASPAYYVFLIPFANYLWGKARQAARLVKANPSVFFIGVLVIFTISFALHIYASITPDSFQGDYSSIEGGGPLVQVTSSNGNLYIAFEKDGVPYMRDVAVPMSQSELKKLFGDTSLASDEARQAGLAIDVQSAIKMPSTGFILFRVDKGSKLLTTTFSEGYGSIGGPNSYGLVPSNNIFANGIASLKKD